jgi:putative nucleotidyltransferase with HDIG domain
MHGSSHHFTGANVNIDNTSSNANPGALVDPADVFQPLLIESVVAGIRNLPTLPSVAAYLLNHLDDDVHLPKVIEMLSYDQVMTARVLRLANSAFAGRTTPPKTVDEAMHLIGLDAVREWVCISAVSGLMVPNRCPDFALKEFWRHSVAVACLAGSLAQHAGAHPSHAFTAGLLHDIGRMVLACTFPVDYSHTLQYQAKTACPILDAERATIGVDHVETGMELARHWKLGTDLQTAIAGHHMAPVLDRTQTASVLAVVCLANLIAHTVDLSDPEDFTDNAELGAGLEALGVTVAQYPEVLSQARTAYRQAMEALSL